MVIKIVYIVSLYCASLSQDPAKFSISHVLDNAASAALHPLIAAGSDRCESIKRFLGLTYEQMLQRNVKTFYKTLNIDLITVNGIVKFNLTTVDLLNNVVEKEKTTVILIHGFMESSDGLMVKAIKSEMLKKKDLEILAVDGRNIISFEYFRSTTYVRFIGEKLGKILSDIVKNGKDPLKITLIGHSLGAHIAGVAGKIFKLSGQTIGRIIALDPAGPCFSNVSVDSRLGRNDANFVDVIHTNAGILGLKEPVGKKDFFPNNGMSQPGCYLSTCDHSRAWEIFAESVNSPKLFPARKCNNWTMFCDGLCARNEIAFMGIDSIEGSSGTYYLTTGSSPPFGLGANGT